MAIHRWWLALVAALLTPWIGPHIDRYVPIGSLLLDAYAEKADAAFWIIGGALLALGYAVWLVLLTGIAALYARSRRGQGSSSGRDQT